MMIMTTIYMYISLPVTWFLIDVLRHTVETILRSRDLLTQASVIVFPFGARDCILAFGSLDGCCMAYMRNPKPRGDLAEYEVFS